MSRRLRAPSFPSGERGRGEKGGHPTREAPRNTHGSTDTQPQRGAGGRQTRPPGPRPAPRPTTRPEGPRTEAAGAARPDAAPSADAERGGPRVRRRDRARDRRPREDAAGYTQRQAPLARSAPAGLTGRLWRPGQRRSCGASAAPTRKAARGGGLPDRDPRSGRGGGRGGVRGGEPQRPEPTRTAAEWREKGRGTSAEASGGSFFARGGGGFSRHSGQRHGRGAEWRRDLRRAATGPHDPGRRGTYPFAAQRDLTIEGARRLQAAPKVGRVVSIKKSAACISANR